VCQSGGHLAERGETFRPSRVSFGALQLAICFLEGLGAPDSSLPARSQRQKRFTTIAARKKKDANGEKIQTFGREFVF
jgi:hypothetical protein